MLMVKVIPKKNFGLKFVASEKTLSISQVITHLAVTGTVMCVFIFCKLQCTGVALMDIEKTYQCCFLTEQTLFYSQPGHQILYYWKEIELLCRERWTGHNCDSCIIRWTGANCSSCDKNLGPPGECNDCLGGLVGENCSQCAPNFGPEGQCDQCVTGRAGENCTQCAPNFGPEEQCDQCVTGRAGENCSECAVNFGPPGQCNSCLSRWAGDNCDSCAQGWSGDNCEICEGFGCCNQGECEGCIQDGKWVGTVGLEYLEVHLTFSGDTCTTPHTGKLNISSNNWEMTI